jgi:hypothetical protein
MFNHPSDPDPNRESSLDAIRVPKWPFWIADGILVTFAFMLFSQTEGAPGSATLLLAVIAVAVGAIAFVIPYLFELLLRYRFLSDQWDDMGATAPLEVRLKQSETHCETLRKAQQQFSREITAQAESSQQLQEQLAVRIQELEQTLAQAADSAAKALDKRTDELQQLVQPLTPRVEKIETQLQELSQQYQQDRASSAAREVSPLPIASEPIPAESPTEAEIQPQDLPPSTEQKPERNRRGLLLRAMEQGNGSGDTPAVKRIIGRTFSPRLGPPEVVAPKVEKLPEDKPHVEVVAEDVNQENTGKIAADTQSTVSEDAPLQTDRGGPSEPDDENSSEDAAPAPPQPEQNKDGQGSPTKEAEEESLFPGMTPTPRRAAKPKSSETVVLARVLIGIGNKPYIRGDLPGLNPDKGIAMDFREIGVWQWVSSEVEAPGKVRIFRNDEEPEQAKAHDIAPGQHLEIQPRFPKQTN